MTGFIDGTHIRLSAAIGGERDYYNRKGYPSIQLQVKHITDLSLVAIQILIEVKFNHVQRCLYMGFLIFIQPITTSIKTFVMSSFRLIGWSQSFYAINNLHISFLW